MRTLLSYSLRLTLLSLFFGQSLFGQNKNEEFYERKLIKLTDDIYVWNRPDPYRFFVEGNVIIIINQTDVIVVESTGTPTGAKQLIAEIKTLTNKPVRYLINTHFHVDHISGNSEFIKAYPGIEIISTSYTRKELYTDDSAYIAGFLADSNLAKKIVLIKNSIKRVKAEAYPGYEKIVDFLQYYLDHDIYVRQKEYKKINLTLPGMTFDNEMTIYRGEREIRIFFPGKGDTPGDAWIYLPKEKIIITGDAVVHPTPYGFSNYPSEWLATLRKSADMDFRIMIPGHGDVQYTKEYLNAMITLLQTLYDQVKEIVANGSTLEETIKKIDITEMEKKFINGDPLRRYFFNIWFKNPAIKEIYKELTGKK